MLADSYGRVATDLRVSLTDRCNLRCAYCMPAEGLDWLPKPELLTDDEVVRLIRVGTERLGIREIRFTGGEPLLRRGLASIVARTAELRPRPEMSITTNGIGLARMAGRYGTPAWTGSTSRSTRSAPRRSGNWPGGTGCPRCWTAWPRRRRPGWPRSRLIAC